MPDVPKGISDVGVLVKEMAGRIDHGTPEPHPRVKPIANAAAVVMALILSSPLLWAGQCHNPASTPQNVPVAVYGKPNRIVCATNVAAESISATDSRGNSVKLTDLVKVRGGVEFAITPTGPDKIHIMSGRVTVSVLTVTDEYGFFLVSNAAGIATAKAQGLVAPVAAQAKKATEIAKAADERSSATRNAVTNIGSKFEQMFGADGTGGSIGGKLVTMDQRLTVLEKRPSGEVKVDMSLFDARLTTIDQQTARDIRHLRVLLESLESQVKEVSADVGRYSQARFKTGLFTKKSILEAAEQAEAEAEKSARKADREPGLARP